MQSTVQNKFMHGWHLVEHVRHKEVRHDNILHVIGVISNPVRYQSRIRLARKWIEHMVKTPCVKLHIVETAFGDRHFELKELCHELGVSFLGLRTKSEIWIKENMINLGEERLVPHDAKYLAWIDCDVFFGHESWAQETIQHLQHHHVVQPWQSAINLGPNGNVMEIFESVGRKIRTGIPKHKKYNGDPYDFGHTGYAWACTRYFWENVGGLIDWAILGSGDHHMALAMRGLVENSVHRQIQNSFMRKCLEWQRKAYRITHGYIGYVPGRIEHHFHGPMKRRFYKTRWNILVDGGYDPDADLMRDDQGVLQLIGKPDLEHAIRLYNRSRFEDSIEEY